MYWSGNTTLISLCHSSHHSLSQPKLHSIKLQLFSQSFCLKAGNLLQSIKISNVHKIESLIEISLAYSLTRSFWWKFMIILFQHKENADAAIRDFSSVIAYQPKTAEGWIRRAEVMWWFIDGLLYNVQILVLGYTGHAFAFSYQWEQVNCI